MGEKDALEIGGKAVEQLDKGLRRGPIIRIISVLSIGLAISLIFNIKFLLDSREREKNLWKLVVEEVRKQAPGMIQEEMKPLREQVGEVINKTDTTLTKTDSLLNRVGEIINK